MNALKSTFRLTHSNKISDNSLSVGDCRNISQMAKMIPTLYWRRSVSILMCTSGNLLWPSWVGYLIAETLGLHSKVYQYLRKLWIGYLIAETLGGEKSVGEDALGVVICHPPPPSLAIIAIIKCFLN